MLGQVVPRKKGTGAAMTRPRWLALGGKEMAEIREQPAMQMLVEWLEWERLQAREDVLQSVASPSGSPVDAKLRAGIALGIDAILRSLNTPISLTEMSDDDFRDPAMRPSLRKERDAEV